MPYLVAPAADFTDGVLTTAANALLRPTDSLTGLTNGTAYRAVRLSEASSPFTPAAAASGFSDTFARADGPLAGGDWTVLFGSATAFGVVSGQIVTGETTETGIACSDLSVGSAGYVEATTHALINGGGVALIQNSQNYVHLRANVTTGLLSVGGRIGNALFGPTNAPGNAAVPVDKLRLEVEGAAWRVYKGATLANSGTLAADLTDMRGGFVSRSVAGMIWDDFAHGPL